MQLRLASPTTHSIILGLVIDGSGRSRVPDAPTGGIGNSSGVPGPRPIEDYFRRMSFFTDLTPATLPATATAVVSAAGELTNPLS